MLHRQRKAALVLAAFIAVSGTARSSSLPRQSETETTIRNFSRQTIRYSIRPHRSDNKSEEKTLEVGAVDRYPGNVAFDVTFRQGEKRITYRIDSGRNYIFRYDEVGMLELFIGSHGRSDAVDLAPYVVTPIDIVDRMLEMAGVDREDVVYDIGCGDGRIVIMAAEKYGARGVGIDIVPERIQESKKNARLAGVESLVEFRLEDATKSDLKEATVVTMYLVPESTAFLRPLLEKQLEPGTRIVSHGYPIPGWENKLLAFDQVEVEFEAFHLIYVYRR
jgi:2-polyprenyl-3-methyl-5-hydroxy-6-metoxy-1,4-benzoquinol methylase